MTGRGLKNILGDWAPVLAWCSLIFYLSSVQNLKTDFGGPIDFILRKGAHVTEYVILFLLSRRAYANSSGGGSGSATVIFAAIFSVLYAASDEYHQSFVPTRGPSVADVGIDCAGVAVGYLIYWAARKHLRAEK